MREMEMMAVFGDPAVVDQSGVQPGERVRMGVRERNAELTLLWVEKAR